MLATLGTIYLIYGIVMTGAHPRFIYPFAAEPFAADGYEQTEIPVPGREPLGAVFHRAADPLAPVILYFMGNIGILGPHQIALDAHVAAGRTVVAMEYRGGGGRPGRPSEAALKADGLALFDALVPLLGPDHGPVFIHGYSLGSGIALHVAANRTVAGVLLDAPYARICDLMWRAAWLPACQMPFVQKWNSLAYVTGIKTLVLIQHGLGDATIPVTDGARLASALVAAGVTVRFEKLKGGSHDNLSTLPPWAVHMSEFIGAAR